MQKNFNRIAVCALAAFLLFACGSDEKRAAEESNAAAETSSAPKTATADGTLEDLLITSVPEGFERIDDDEVGAGPSDFAKAVSDDGGADAEEVLTSAGFVSGYQRGWQTTDQSGRIIVFLYEFSKADGAGAYADRAIEGYDADPSIEPTPFDVEGIPDASGRSLTNLLADGQVAAAVVFTKAGYLVQIWVLGADVDESQALAQELALDQFSRL